MSWTVTIGGAQWAQLHAHLFPGDQDEHGAVLRCGIAGTRLLVREVIPAVDGRDYVPGTSSYRRLAADFITGQALRFAEDNSVYIAVHNHGGDDEVGFSDTDMRSHERSYPALLQLTDAPAVGALVFAVNAVAGDIWAADGTRYPLEKLVVTGPTRRELHPAPRTPEAALPAHNRQALLFGAAGQDILRRQKVAIIGLGGAGSLINEMISRLGVGHLVLIDADRIETTNLSRIVGATRFDAHTWLTAEDRPAWVQRLGERLAAPKVRIAKRVAKQASLDTRVDVISSNVEEPDVWKYLIDCDHIFLAADSHTARLVVNAIAHQYLITVTQVGAKAQIEDTGDVTAVYSVSRPIEPGRTCLRCNGLISPAKLTEEATPTAERKRQLYVDDVDVHAPSVITLNAVAASVAVNEWLMRTVGLAQRPNSPDWVTVDALHGEFNLDGTRQDVDCPWCGPQRYAQGDSTPLPVKVR
jgi:molybdopterin/thiamine biosynthesis adenylyltransferase